MASFATLQGCHPSRVVPLKGVDLSFRILYLSGMYTKIITQIKPLVNRTVYFCKGQGTQIAGVEIPPYQAIELLPENEVIIENGAAESEFLLLQGRPINESVVQHGPFVMNTHGEIQEAIRDFRTSRFGGWPWPRPDMVHDKSLGRFARYSDGREETPHS